MAIAANAMSQDPTLQAEHGEASFDACGGAFSTDKDERVDDLRADGGSGDGDDSGLVGQDSWRFVGAGLFCLFCTVPSM